MTTYNHKDLLVSTDTLIEKIDNFLSTCVIDGHFDERTFYAEAFYAAGLKLLNRRVELQQTLFDHYFNNQIKHDTHPEFNAYAWQYYFDETKCKDPKMLINKIKFKQLFMRKVSNWVLLRSLVRIRRGGFSWVAGILQAIVIIEINSHRGFTTDNSLRMLHKKSTALSSQYHAFATMILGEIYIETKFSYFKEKFIKGAEKIIIDKRGNNLNWRGRGRKQIFGYASMARCFSLAYFVTFEDKYLHELREILLLLHENQYESGEIPLVIASKNKQKIYWETYNNRFDYLSFLFFQLAETRRLLNLSYH